MRLGHFIRAQQVFLRALPRVAIALLLALPFSVSALHPNHPLGFDPERNTQTSADGIDHVDLFSGSLSLTIPVGPFVLNYSSNVWRYRPIAAKGGPLTEAVPDRATNAGLGWHLGWGEVYHASHGLNDTGTWLYVGADGGRHTFSPELHEDDGSDPSHLWYTRDGSYLRLRLHSNVYVDIEFPDGTTRRFDSGTGGLQSTYFLHKVWSAFASADDPDSLIEYDRETPGGKVIGLERTVTDRYGRTHYVHLTDQYSWIDQVITQIDIQDFQGQRLLFDFSYDPVLVNRSCKDTASSPPNHRISVPHLSGVTLPDGTSYGMKDGSQLLYYNECKNELDEPIDDVPGVLTGIDLPTGGKIRWSFQEYEFPPGDTSSVFNTSAGVETRRLLDSDDAEQGRWHYRTSSFTPTNGDDPELYTEVSVLPEGDCTKHFFNARYYVTPSEWRGWEYGLPFVYSEQSDGKYLSTRVFATSSATGSCTGSALRSTYLRFRHDTPPGGSDPAEWRALNRQVEALRVVYHDDGDRYTDTEYSEFDGLGHFRRAVNTGNFRDDSTTAERRETFIGYNRATGTYPGSYVPVADSVAWILGIFDETLITEDDAVGEAVARAEYGFDDTTGFLFCTRTLASGIVRDTNDLLTVRERAADDVEGLAGDVKRYGSDNQPLAITGDDCGVVPSQPDYWLHHDYAFGELIKTTTRTPAGMDATFSVYDVDLDPMSGRLLRTRDTAGYTVEYDYDDVGRISTITPQDGGRVAYSYTTATSSNQAKVTTTLLPAAGSEVLAQAEVVADDFGRMRLERRLLADGTFREQETIHNARGWVTSISQLGSLAKVTAFLDFDPFGRPATVRPPDGAAHDVRMIYQGDRTVTDERKIALADGEAYVPTIREVDRYGRLRKVRELSGPAVPGLEETLTTYDYDVGNRLTESVSGTDLTQTRHFVYDNRAFLLSETHPEKGALGNGTVFYYDYDSAGLPHRMLDGPHDLTSVYDFLGRLIRTNDRNQGNRIVTLLKWDIGAGLGEGKLKDATHYNYVDLPWSSAGEETVSVRQVFTYSGVGGAVSRKITKVLWSLDNVTFRQDFTYDDLGMLVSQKYPRCTAPGFCASSEANDVRTVTRSYTNGWLTNVDGWTTQVDYHPSGTWKSVHHANGVVDHFTPDPDFTQRALRIHTTSVSPTVDNFDTGSMSYDGAGFIKGMGTDTFAYDGAGRLVSASMFDGDLLQQYSYDRFGNVLAIEPNSPGSFPTVVDSATNRLSGTAVYDGAGNLESWGPYQWRYNTADQVVLQGPMRYLYDAFGERAVTIANAGIGEENARFHLRDHSNRLSANISVSNGVWSRERDYVYGLGRVLASSEDGPAFAHHYHQDHLGSTRLTTHANGNTRFQFQFLPYGEEIWQTRDDSIMFTGHERDFSTGADYMHARHYHHDLARFLSVDAQRGNVSLPQSLNRNAYALGNPLNFTDPAGAAPAAVFSDYITVTSSFLGSGFVSVGLPKISLFFLRQFFGRNQIPREEFGSGGRGGRDERPETTDGSDSDGNGETDSEDPPFDPSKCPKPFDAKAAQAKIDLDTKVAIRDRSAHGKLLKGTEIATIFAPLGFGKLARTFGAAKSVVNFLDSSTTGFSYLLYLANSGRSIAEAESAARRQSPAYKQQFPMKDSPPTIGPVDARCPAF